MNTMSGRELIFPFGSPEEESSSSPFSQSQTDVIQLMSQINDRERTTERKQARTRIHLFNLIRNKDATGVRTREEKERDSEIGGLRKKQI